MTSDRPICDTLDEQAAREGEADADAGRVIPQAEMAEWLRTWGTPDEKPAPTKWFKSSAPRMAPPPKPA